MKFTCQLSVSSFNLEDFEKLEEKLKEVLETKIVKDLKLSGPISMERKDKLFTINRSPHGNKKSRDQFFLTTHRKVWLLVREGLVEKAVFYGELLSVFKELSSLDSISFSWKISIKNL